MKRQLWFVGFAVRRTSHCNVVLHLRSHWHAGDVLLLRLTFLICTILGFQNVQAFECCQKLNQVSSGALFCLPCPSLPSPPLPSFPLRRKGRIEKGSECDAHACNANTFVGSKVLGKIDKICLSIYVLHYNRGNTKIQVTYRAGPRATSLELCCLLVAIDYNAESPCCLAQAVIKEVTCRGS